MNFQFTQNEAEMAQSFIDKASLWQNKPVLIRTEENENDTLEVGAFFITKVMDTQVTKSILGEHTQQAVAYVVTTTLPEFNSDAGYSEDVAEIAREWTLPNALKACAHAELEWKLDSHLADFEQSLIATSNNGVDHLRVSPRL